MGSGQDEATLFRNDASRLTKRWTQIQQTPQFFKFVCFVYNIDFPIGHSHWSAKPVTLVVRRQRYSSQATE